MNRDSGEAEKQERSVPRVCGDEPVIVTRMFRPVLCAPRLRG